MLHNRPTLIPIAMRTPCKISRTISNQEPTTPCPLINPEEIVVVEPTDPDEDRLKELQRQKQEQQHQLPHTHPQLTVQPKPSATQESVRPLIEANPIKPNAPKTATNTSILEVLQSLLSAAVRSSPIVLNGTLPSNNQNRIDSTHSGIQPCLGSSELPTVMLQTVTPTVNITGPSGIHMTPTTAESHSSTAAADSLHPLVAALLVNCATVNLITQHVRSLGVPLYITSPQNNFIANPNITSILSGLLSNIPVDSINAQQPDSTHSVYPPAPAQCVNTNKDAQPEPSANLPGPLKCPSVPATKTEGENAERSTSSIVQSLLNEAKNAIEASKFSPSTVTKTSNRVKRFKCPMPNCHLAFYSRFNQTEHIRTHTGERPFVCTVPNCVAAFKRRRDLRDHLNGHSNCLTPAVIADVASDKPQLHHHDHPDAVRSNPSSPDTKAEPTDVPMTFDEVKSEADFCNPIKSNNHDGHSLPGSGNTVERGSPFKPDGQDEPTSRPVDCSALKTSTNIRRHVCHYANCDKAYAKLNKLKEHLRSHTGERPYVCREPGCGAAFIRLYGVRRHELTHVFGKQGGGVRRSTRPGDRIHKTENGVPPSISDDSNPDISEHSIAGSPSVTPPVTSSTSSIKLLLIKDFESTSPMLVDAEETAPAITEAKPDSSHSPTVPHTPSRRVFPVIAPKTPIQPQYKPQPPIRPLSPISGSPGMRRPHACPFKECGKAFPKLNKLREHICRHTGERPFVCSQCNASFVRMYDLRRHGKIHLRAARQARHDDPRPLAPKQNSCEPDSALIFKPEPDSTFLC